MAALAFLNISEYEKDPFGTIQDKTMVDDVGKVNYDSHYSMPIYVQIYVIIILILKLIISLCVISADVFLICVICKFKKLRTNRINVYIINCCIVNIYMYLYMPLDYIIFYLMFNLRGMTPFIIDIESQTATFILYFILTFVLAMDWFVSSYRPSILESFNKYYLFFILGFNLIFVISWILKSVLFFIFRYETIYYFSDMYDRHQIYKAGVYVTILIGLLILNVLKKTLSLPKASVKNCYALTTVNIIVFSFLPLFIYNVLYRVSDLHIFLRYIISWTEDIPELIADINPVIIVYMLGRENKDFKIAYDRCFKRSLRSYASSNLNDDSNEENELENNLRNAESLDGNPEQLNGQQQQQILVF